MHFLIVHNNTKNVCKESTRVKLQRILIAEMCSNYSTVLYDNSILSYVIIPSHSTSAVQEMLDWSLTQVHKAKRAKVHD